MSQEEPQLLPGELRLLRRFFHRYALSYAAIGLAIVGLASLSTHALRPAGSPPPPEEEPPPAVDLAAFESTRAAAEGLLVELQQAAQRDQDNLAAAERRIGALEARIASAQKQLRKLEAQAAAASAAPPAVPPAPAPAPTDPGDVLERLYNLEVRQDQVEARSAKYAAERGEALKSVLDRLYELETRATALEQTRTGFPAPPAPSSTDTP